MYRDLIQRLRVASVQARMVGSGSWADLMQEASDAVEALERNAGCPAWDGESKHCSIFGMPVEVETDV